MSSTVTFLLSMSCAIPAFIGLYIYRKAGKRNHPFIWAMLLAVLAEVVARISIVTKIHWLLPSAYNIYIPLNLACYLLFFYRNGIIQTKQQLNVVSIISLIGWIASFCFLKSYLVIFMFAHTINCVIIVIAATEALSRMVFQKNLNALMNFHFLMTIGCLFMFGYFILIGTTMLLGTDYAMLRSKLFGIYIYVSAFVYVLFAYSLLCLSKAKIYSE